MDAIKIKVADYYGNPSYYSVMPNEIFDALELASLKGEMETDVDKVLFTQMVDNYKKKMALCKR
jgi:hypothetical protein